MSLRRAGLGPALLLAAALAGGCASFVPPQTAALREAAPAELRQPVELHAVPFFPQTAYHCGPAALATALGAAGLKADPALLGEQIFLPSRQGTLQLEMLGGARRHGALAMRIPGELDALLREVSAGRPVVVLLNLSLPIRPLWHYAVVVGHDLVRGELVLRSGTTEREVMSLRTFEHTWARSGHWAFVAVPPGELARTVTEREATAATVAFERVAPPADAVRAYRAALARWPGSLTLAMGLGSALHAQGLTADAAAVLEAAARQHDSAAAWNNLARLRSLLGERDAARDAAERALARAEAAEPQWREAAQATRAALR
ncbi:PA2778 family cysteine peptidase [Caldimonas tepidiphila]|uniref:PA2778 family cysteine peptidase n=1 Tax=Caldimonas tepidiphila TaxID=2315841 RepID=UPI000E5B5B6B|nr:PA2778 family cysteine peptidase [Caldimonas tepidiphila]